MSLSRTIIAGLTAAVASSVVLTGAADARPAAPPVRITAAQYDSPGNDTGSNRSLNSEWVKIKNSTRKAKSLTGWTIRDPQGHVYRFPKFRLGAGKSVTLHTGSGRNTAAHLYWGEDYYVWNNTGDRAILKNSTGKRVDVCSWDDGDGSTGC